MSPNAGAQRLAISVDLDAPLDYCRFYRFGFEPPSDPFLGEALPYLLDLFGELGIRATFFVIARDLAGAEARRWLRRAAELGQELGNHSAEHPHAFRWLSRAEKAREIDQAAARIEETTGVRVVGFRCPAYDLDRDLLELLLERRYLYDSSLVPSPFLLPMKWIVRLKARRWRVGLGELGHAWAPRAPHFYGPGGLRLAAPEGETLLELPLTVLPFLRFPFWGTITQILGEGPFRRAMALLRRDGLPINYGLHAAEVVAMGSGADGAERVPGYGADVTARRQRLRATLAEMVRGLDCCTLAEVATEARARLASAAS
jgi:hypothetical protein